MKQSAIPTKSSTDEPKIHLSNPEGLSHPQLAPSYLHTKTAMPTAIVRPLDRPDSLFFSSLRILPSLDRSISILDMDVNTHLHLLEKKAAFIDDALLTSNPSLAGLSAKEHDQTAPPLSLSRRLVRTLDLKLFCEVIFLVLCASFILLQLAYFIPFVYFLTFALNAGLSRSDGMLLLTILGVLHTFGRLVGGILANIPRVDIVIVTAVCCILCAICHIALPFLPQTFYAFAIYSSLFGFLCGKSSLLNIMSMSVCFASYAMHIFGLKVPNVYWFCTNSHCSWQ